MKLKKGNIIKYTKNFNLFARFYTNVFYIPDTVNVIFAYTYVILLIYMIMFFLSVHKKLKNPLLY
ncbi:hypothetical protein RhiirC2_299526 [Rhizophagus irregularis]|uniref:Uncharacterized protein n=1 Tax=Rhizophagus irregularis TaxID=588596 RepID=A0A2N1NKC0_9GLOM|nr:hypothetical protein RhiirC2_299526 [Rhizophagus irregularis]